jgi:hypothetical protein
MPRRVIAATWVAFGLHGLLILTARYRLSYDAYNHMFFADHYLQDWWSLWEPRWYTGFEVISYPPLVHQLIALAGRIIGVDAAFGLVLWVTLTAYPLAIYLFARIFAGRAAAGYAALGGALLPSLFLTAHVFGQLPTLAATLLALFGAGILADYLRRGGWLTGALTVCLFAAVMAAHHATLLFVPWLVGAVAAQELLERGFTPRPLFRLAIFTALAVLAGWLVIFPFWQWGAEQTLQTPIDHLSRHNFFRDPFAAALFFLPMYGLLIPLIPAAFGMSLQRRFRGLGLAFLFLFLLGLGDSTPLPRLLFGPSWAWLTYDRFAFWASLVLLVFFGTAAVTVRHVLSPKHLRSSVVKLGNAGMKLFATPMTFVALLIALIPTWLPTQPPQLDLHPIVDFLSEGGRSQYRYITFGFGDQLARLSRLTPATTIDGSYHTARTLPELRASGLGQLDTAFWLPGGLSRLDPILEKSGERGVRWGFVNLHFYGPIMLRNNWKIVTTLSNGVVVWENPDASPSPPVEPPEGKPFTAFAWGVFPLAALSLSGALAARRYTPILATRWLGGIQSLATGLLPLGLTLWAYRHLFEIPFERIYFTYSDALFFVSDGLALVIVAAWLILKLPTPISAHLENKDIFLRPATWFFTLCVIASLSIAWSLDRRISLYIALHFWLAFGLYLSLRDRPGLWRPFAIGSAAALLLQAAIGIGQFTAQSTAFAMALGLDWPGSLVPAMSGASVVQLADGTRWLRAYGTLPHPNLLGGWTLVLLTSLLTLGLLPSKGKIPVPIPFAAGLVVLVLTFSRSAWLGLTALGAVILVRRKIFERKALVRLAIIGLAALTLLAIPLKEMLTARLVPNQIQTEQVSNYTRFWLIQRTWEIIQKSPIFGVGIGAYSLALSQHVALFYDIEPVHNIPLLIWSELGPAGIAVLTGLGLTVGINSLKARRPLTVIFSAALAGIFVLALFDHYLWTLAPGRILFASVLGLWAGQVNDERGG